MLRSVRSLSSRLFVLVLLLFVGSTAAQSVGHGEPPLGTNLYVTNTSGGTSQCLVVLDTEWMPTTQPDIPYMDTYLDDPNSANRAWLGLVRCEEFFAAYPATATDFYNQRMAVLWRASEDTNVGLRLRSWVQSYACLDIPAPADKSTWLWDCNEGATQPVNHLSFDAGKIKDGNGQCLAPKGGAITWPTVKDASADTLQVTAVLPQDCSVTGAQGWAFSTPPFVTYPIHGKNSVAYMAYLLKGDGANGYVEPSLGYNYTTIDSEAPAGYYYSWYTPFSVREDDFPVQVKVCHMGDDPVAVRDKGAVVMSIRQYEIPVSSVTYPQPNCVQFPVESPGQISIALKDRTQDHLALFVDPVPTQNGTNLAGCSATGPCIDGKFFLGPGYYPADSPICAKHLVGLGDPHTEKSTRTQLHSPVDIELSGGAILQCKVDANLNGWPTGEIPATDGKTSTSVSLHGSGVIDGFPWTGWTSTCGAGCWQTPLLHACADSVTIEGVVFANTPHRTQGNLTANSPWMCDEGTSQHGQVLIEYAKQIAGHEGQADGFDIGSNSNIGDSFIESNDDGIKMISSSQHFEDITIWKNNHGWAIECGWGVSGDKNETVSATNVDIHFIWQDDADCCGESCDGPSPPDCEPCPQGTTCTPARFATCQDPHGKVAAIGCQIAKDVSKIDFRIQNVHVRNLGSQLDDSQCTKHGAAAGCPVNRLQRGFAIGMAYNGWNGTTCPGAAMMTGLLLSNLYFPPFADSANKSSFFVDSGGTAEIEGGMARVFENCTNPGFPENLCDNALKPGEGGYNTIGNVNVPEPASGLAAWVCLLTLGAIRSARRFSHRC